MRPTERRCAHAGAFFAPSWLSLAELLHSPEPRRCVERTVLNCLAYIIANLQPVVGGELQNFSNFAKQIFDRASSSAGRDFLSPTPLYYRAAAISHAEIFS